MLLTSACPIPGVAGVTNDLFAFDTSTLLWTGLGPAGPPSPRAYHGFAAAAGRLFVFAGQGPAGPRCALPPAYERRLPAIETPRGDWPARPLVRGWGFQVAGSSGVDRA